MSAGSKIGITAVLLLFLAGLAAADTLTTEGVSLRAFLTDDEPQSDQPGIVRKNNGPLLADAAGELGMSLRENKEESLLAGIAGEGTAVYSHIILQDDDRIGTVTWLESPQAKDMFIALKEALLGEFSGGLQDLQDQTFQEEGKPVRNVLAFKDPAISTEAKRFYRVRERLYEVDIAPEREADMNALLEALTER